jgi:spoIIIJ-associated protein
MKEIEVKAKNAYDAICEACEKLGVAQDEVNCQVLKEGGMFSKGVYLVSVKETKAKTEPKTEEKKQIQESKARPVTQDGEKTKARAEGAKPNVRPVTEEREKPKAGAEGAKPVSGSKFEVTTNFVTKLLELLENDAKVTTERTDTAFNINIDGENIGRLIGKNGVVMNAIQTLVSTIAIANANGEGTRVFVNIGDYKEKRGDTLQALAIKKAEKVKETGRYIKLEPMNARDRAIIHTALSEVKGIKTYSTGQDPFRCLCIAPADSDEKNVEKKPKQEN